MAAAIATTTSARAEEVLAPGTTITRPDGTTTVLEEARVVLDKGDTARLVVLQRAEIRCQAALVDCEEGRASSPATPPRTATPWVIFGAAAVGLFAAGVVVGVTAH